MITTYQENTPYSKDELANIADWWKEHQEYDINEYENHIEITLRPNWEAEQLQRFRRERKQVCFPVINRGSLWYSRLTIEQKEELDVWYQAWLDVTETKVKPETPSWI